MSFHEKDWKARYAELGDQAEQAFFAQFPKAHRVGLCRPEFSMNGMRPTMRYAPDFMLRDMFVEVMGISSRKDGLLKIKLEKLNALLMWVAIGDVHLWVYDSSTRNSWQAPIDEWAAQCWLHAERHTFADNNKPYWSLPTSHFPEGSNS